MILNTIDWNEWHGIWLLPYPSGLSFMDRIYVRYRDGSTSKIRVVGDLRWKIKDLPDDIIAWRFSHHVDEGS